MLLLGFGRWNLQLKVRGLRFGLQVYAVGRGYSLVALISRVVRGWMALHGSCRVARGRVNFFRCRGVQASCVLMTNAQASRFLRIR